MSLAPCPSPSQRSISPSYSRKTQEELDTQFLHDRIQQYYLQQQRLKHQHEEDRKKCNGGGGSQKQIDLNSSAAVSVSSKKTKQKSSVTLIGAAKAGKIAIVGSIGPIPLEFPNPNMTTPSPGPPCPSPTTQRSESVHFQGYPAATVRSPRVKRKVRPKVLKIHSHNKNYYSQTSTESNSPPPPRSSSSPTTSSSTTSSSSMTSPQKLYKQLSTTSPRGSSPRTPRSPRMVSIQGHPLVDELHPKKYFAIPPSSLSPIPQGISPSPNGGRSPVSPYANSPNISPRTTPRTSPHHSKPSSPRRSPSPAAMAPASGSVSPWGATTPRPFSPQKTGNLARLASRRKSVAQNRRTSNYLELPVSDYEMRQRRYCSLPESTSYNPRQLQNELYRLRSFSIKPNGSLIKHGDQIATRRKSRSSAGSTTTTSRNNSPYASQSHSRDLSPRTISPCSPGFSTSFNFPSTGPSSVKSNKSSGDPSIEDLDNVDTEDGNNDEEEEESERFRICILGSNRVGKTALVNQFLTSEYMNTYDASLDDEYGERSVSVSLDGDESELIFIDHTAGEMSTENTLSTYEPHGCVIVYSAIDRQSFKTAEEILGYLWRFGYTKSKSMILVANKVDLERSRTISIEEGRSLARNCDAKFIETSAGIEHNVDELLVGILKQIRLRIEQDKMSISSKKEGNPTNENESCVATSTVDKKRDVTNRRLSSPLRTLQVARDIITRTCLKSSKNRPVDCENLHII